MRVANKVDLLARSARLSLHPRLLNHDAFDHGRNVVFGHVCKFVVEKGAFLGIGCVTVQRSMRDGVPGTSDVANPNIITSVKQL